MLVCVRTPSKLLKGDFEYPPTVQPCFHYRVCTFDKAMGVYDIPPEEDKSTETMAISPHDPTFEFLHTMRDFEAKIQDDTHPYGQLHKQIAAEKIQARVRMHQARQKLRQAREAKSNA